MQNGHDPASATRQINPQQAAAFALQFLARASHTRAERDSYDVAEGLLNAIMNGQVVLAPPQAVAAPAADPPSAPVPEPPQ